MNNNNNLWTPESPDPFDSHYGNDYKTMISNDYSSSSSDLEVTSPSYCPTSPIRYDSQKDENNKKIQKIVSNPQSLENHKKVCEYINGNAFSCAVLCLANIKNCEKTGKLFGYGYCCESWKGESYLDDLTDNEKKIREHSKVCEFIHSDAHVCKNLPWKGFCSPPNSDFIKKTYNCKAQFDKNLQSILDERDKIKRDHVKDCEYIKDEAEWCQILCSKKYIPNPFFLKKDVKLSCGYNYYGKLVNCELCGVETPYEYCNDRHCLSRNQKAISDPNDIDDQKFRKKLAEQMIKDLKIQLKSWKENKIIYSNNIKKLKKTDSLHKACSKLLHTKNN